MNLVVSREMEPPQMPRKGRTTRQAVFSLLSVFYSGRNTLGHRTSLGLETTVWGVT